MAALPRKAKRANSPGHVASRQFVYPAIRWSASTTRLRGALIAKIAAARYGFMAHVDQFTEYTNCFVGLNLSAIAPTLIESELFGHSAGGDHFHFLQRLCVCNAY